MGAARVVMTMAVLAIGGGGLLAIATIPALAPYQQRKPDRSAPAIFAPERRSDAGIDTGAPPATSAYNFDFAPPLVQENSEENLGMGDGEGTLEPRWMQDGGEWLSLGRRAWHDWVEPGDSDDAANLDERREPRSDRRRWDEGGYGAGQNFGRHPDRRWRGEDEADDYGEQDRWSSSAEPPLPPAARAPDDFANRRSPDAEAVRPDVPVDAAASAAERARQAARDVRAAEGVQ